MYHFNVYRDIQESEGTGRNSSDVGGYRLMSEMADRN
jgi:hypothetical protein